MTDASAGPAPDITYPLDYDLPSSAVSNLDFKGPGLLTIRNDGPTCTFSGKPRGLLSAKSGELVFRHDDIVDMEVSGRTIRFRTGLGTSGRNGQHFVFHLRDDQEAQAVAALLPKSVDLEFVEQRDFNARLAQLVESRNSWLTATNVIIALNVAVFVIMGMLGAGWLQTEDMMPYILYGANNGAATTDGEWWRLLTSMFMHYGIMHLLLNMWALYLAGHLVEKLLGLRPYLLAYLGSGLAGSLASIAWHGDQSWSAGASGAVFGIYGAILGFSLRQKQAIPASVFQSMLKSTLGFAGYNILYGFARSGIDNAAHAGGLLGGIAFGWLLALPLEAEVRNRETRRRLQQGFATLGVILVAGFALTPRFDYRVKDVLALEQANKDFGGPEAALLKQHQESLAGVGTDTNAETYAVWLETTAMPLYENWRHKLTGLKLAPDKSTHRTRDILVRIFDLRLQSYRNLAAALRAHDNQAKQHFESEEAGVVAEIKKLPDSNLK